MDGMVPRVGGLTRPTFSVWVARDRIAPKLERTAQAPEFEPTALKQRYRCLNWKDNGSSGKIMVPEKCMQRFLFGSPCYAASLLRSPGP
jgi:hypothetical protein